MNISGPKNSLSHLCCSISSLLHTSLSSLVAISFWQTFLQYLCSFDPSKRTCYSPQETSIFVSRSQRRCIKPFVKSEKLTFHISKSGSSILSSFQFQKCSCRKVSKSNRTSTWILLWAPKLFVCVWRKENVNQNYESQLSKTWRWELLWEKQRNKAEQHKKVIWQQTYRNWNWLLYKNSNKV